MESEKDLDLLFVTFDAQKISLEAVRKKITDHGFATEMR